MCIISLIQVCIRLTTPPPISPTTSNPIRTTYCQNPRDYNIRHLISPPPVIRMTKKDPFSRPYLTSKLAFYPTFTTMLGAWDCFYS